jgi:hypothetical protein
VKTYTLTVSTDDHCYCGVSFQADTMADLTELVDRMSLLDENHKNNYLISATKEEDKHE